MPDSNWLKNRGWWGSLLHQINLREEPYYFLSLLYENSSWFNLNIFIYSVTQFCIYTLKSLMASLIDTFIYKKKKTHTHAYYYLIYNYMGTWGISRRQVLWHLRFSLRAAVLLCMLTWQVYLLLSESFFCWCRLRHHVHFHQRHRDRATERREQGGVSTARWTDRNTFFCQL